MLPKVTKIKIDEARTLFKEKIKFIKIEQRTFLELLSNRPSMGFSRQEYWSGVPLPSPLFA